jgi:hypothetical protein
MTKIVEVEFDLRHAPEAIWQKPEEVLRPWLITRPDESGEQHARCPLHDDRAPSLGVNFRAGLWICRAGCGAGPIGELVQRMSSETVGSPPERESLASPSAKAELPSPATVQGWHERLLTAPTADVARHYLSETRGVGETTWKEHLLGWDGQSITLPVFDGQGNVVNLRTRRLGPGQNFVGLKGHSGKHLFPATSEIPTEGRVFIVEGEFDALVLREHGFPAFTSVGGAGVLPDVVAQHVDDLSHLDVYVWTDADQAGHDAAQGVQEVLGEAGVTSTAISPQGAPEGFDVSDYYRLYGYDFAERVEALLRRPTVEETSEREVAAELHRLRVRETARNRYRLERAREHGAGPPDLADVPTAEDWFLQPDDEPTWRVEGVIQEGHNVMLGARDKVGKTTLAVDLAVTLTTSEDRWLGKFQVTPSAGKVGWLNCEMTDRQLKSWLISAGVDPARFAHWPGRSNVPNLLDPEWWKVIEQWIVREDVTFLIVDSLTEIVAAAGLDEDKEGIEVLSALNRLRQTTGLSELLVLAHHGHNGNRVRGTSKFGGWVDTKLTYELDEEERRFLSGTGRDTHLSQGEIMRTGTGRFVFQEGEKPVKKTDKRRKGDEDLAAVILGVLRSNEGIGTRELRDRVKDEWKASHGGSGVGNERCDRVLNALLKDGRVRTEGEGRGTSKKHYVEDAS